MLFAGQYEVRLERKKRILLPKMFFKSLEKQSYKGFFLFPSLNGRNIEACGEAWLAYWSRKMDEQGSVLNKNEVILSNILDHMVPCEADKSGRILLPSDLVERYNLQTPLMLAGRGFRFQIWNKDEFITYRKAMQGRLNEIYNSCDQGIKPEEKKEETKKEDTKLKNAEVANPYSGQQKVRKRKS